jgi:hypothetical protein
MDEKGGPLVKKQMPYLARLQRPVGMMLLAVVVLLAIARSIAAVPKLAL